MTTDGQIDELRAERGDALVALEGMICQYLPFDDERSVYLFGCHEEACRTLARLCPENWELVDGGLRGIEP